MTEIEVPQPNIPLLRKAVEWAEAEAAKTDGTGLWNQTEWAATYEDECGTSFCIAGYAVMNGVPEATLAPPDPEWQSRGLLIAGLRADWAEAGQRVLGLTYEERYALFGDTNEIADVRRIAEEIAARAGERL